MRTGRATGMSKRRETGSMSQRMTRAGFGRALACSALAGLWLAGTAHAQGAAIIPLPLDGAPGLIGVPGAPVPSILADPESLGIRLLHGTQRGSSAGQGVEAAPLTEMISPLRPVEARGRPVGSAIRFDGESRSLDFELYIPDPGQVRALRIATLSSINVLPERSSFRVYVNDTLAGTGRLEHVTQTGAMDFALGAASLRSGANAVRIELNQYHRIYCGPEAAFALWSDIDLARSGAVMEGPVTPGRDAFLMGLVAGAATGAGLEIRGTEILGEHRDAWVGALTQRIARVLGGDPIPFRFTPVWPVAGSVPATARITFLPAERPEIRHVVGGDSAQVMIVGVPPGQAAVALPDFDQAFPPRPARVAAPLIEAARPVALSEFGFRSIELRDRYSLTELRFRLPDDYLVLTNAKSEMALTYVYADDLPPGSAMHVKINGTTVRLLPLRGEGGQLIQSFPIRFEGRHLRGGVNTLGFEVFVPGDPADLPCATRDLPVVAISDSSTISATYSPSMYLADMHYAFSSLVPESVQTGDLTARMFDSLDVLTLRAALNGTRRPHAGWVDTRLHLIALEDLGGVPLGQYQVGRRDIEAVLTAPEPEEVLLSGVEEREHILLRNERQRDAAPLAALTSGWEWLRASTSAALQWMHPRAGLHLAEWLSEQRGQAILLQLDPEQPHQIWMLRAPGSDMGAITAAVTAARASGLGPRGQVSVLDHEGQWRNWFAPDRKPVLLEPVTPSNFRHVFGNIVSATPIRYVAGLFFLAALSGLVALMLIIRTRES